MKTTPRFALGLALAMTIAMSPAGFAQDILIEPDSLNFGTVPIGLAGLPWNYREVTITNRSNADLTLQINTVNLPNPDDFELFSPEAAAIHPIIRQIYDAVGCYRQDYGEYPLYVYELAELEYLEIDEEILWHWQFSFAGQDPICQIWANNLRYDVIFDVQTGHFSTYDNVELEPLQEIVLASGRSETFVVSYAPFAPEEFEGWISVIAQDRQERLYLTGSSYLKEALEVSTPDIDFGEVYAGRRSIRELQITNTAGIACRFDFEYSDPAIFYIFDPKFSDIHDYILTAYEAILRYKSDNNENPRSFLTLTREGYLDENDLMLDEWHFDFISGYITARSTDQCHLGRGYTVRFSTVLEIFRGDGFLFDQMYQTTLGKDRSFDLLAVFAPKETGATEGDIRIHAFAGERNTFQEYVIRMNGSGLSVSDQYPDILPNSISLSPPFPNPFNSTTIVSFQTPFAGEVQVGLMDESGRELRQFEIPASAGMMSNRAGSGRFMIDGAGLPAGGYWVNIRQGKNSASQRVILVK